MFLLSEASDQFLYSLNARIFCLAVFDFVERGERHFRGVREPDKRVVLELSEMSLESLEIGHGEASLPHSVGYATASGRVGSLPYLP